ncbi:MAG: hypothetical protein IT577_18685 [Verrucomicrobiae bacterium]|nr:hypothetical protein [Verrucomicrobiae bacterium]
MSEHAASPPAPERFRRASAGALPVAFMGGGILCLAIALAWGLAAERQQFAHSWLCGFMYCFTICAGSLFWVLLHHAVDANWSVVVRRLFETVASLFPYLALLFVPLLFCLPDLYRWLTLDPHADHALAHKSPYLNKGFLLVRLGFYFLYFTFAATLFRTKSVMQDQTGDPRLSLSMRRWSNGLILLFAISITFAGFDLLMALDHTWYSTMWGVYIFAGSALSSMALAILLTFLLRGSGYFKGVLTVEHNHIMGKLLFAFTVFWAYIGFSQYMLIYYSNIPEETLFFLRRNTGSWLYLSLFLVVGHFILPFLLILTQPAKRDGRRLLFAACWLLFMHAVDMFWIVAPSLQAYRDLAAGGHGDTTGFAIHPLDVLCLLGFVGILAALFLRNLEKFDLFPSRDPRLMESITLKN